MTPEWLDALILQLRRNHDSVLVTIARTQGSAPREAGTCMHVTLDKLDGTIGGGHLEWQAFHHARTMLGERSRSAELLRYSLGAQLGQCCGGVVWLLFERIPAASLPLWETRRETLMRGGRIYRSASHSGLASDWSESSKGRYGTHLSGTATDWSFAQEISGVNFPVFIFGAGHVARAVVRQLELLHADMTVIDSRDEGFTDMDTETIHSIVTDTPESEVMAAPPGTYFIVMTHNHAIDFSICTQIYKRHDFAYFGLIGSASKRASFERRLLDRGLPPERLEEMSCPIGIAGISGKEPEIIALSVAAQILQIQSARDHAARPRPTIPQPQMEQP